MRERRVAWWSNARSKINFRKGRCRTHINHDRNPNREANSNPCHQYMC